ncbi:hypothetical protein ACQYWQ_11685 [Streptomyces sp. P6-2-1]|uniref:hypothetical protein n=1 Tax=unclassified Streptomyces TaxID=2593676 RepID=UPI003D35EB3D
MGFKGLDDKRAPQLASAITVTGGAYAIQGNLVDQILNKWALGIDVQFHQEARWAEDNAKHVWHMLKLTMEDPSATLGNGALAGVLETWIEYKGAIKSWSAMTGIEAALRLYDKWKAGKNVTAAQKALELSRTIAGLGSKDAAAAERAITEALAKSKNVVNAFKEPWKWQKLLGGVLDKSKFWLPDWLRKIPKNAPGAGVLSKITVPLAAIHGIKEMFTPDHSGAQAWVDRGMGGVELVGAGMAGAGMIAGASGTIAGVTVAAAVPVVGWAALGVTGAYFLGTWAWDKWGDDVKGWGKSSAKAIGNWGKDQGKAIGNWGKDKGQAIGNATKNVYDGAKKGAEDAVDGAVDGAKKVVKNVLPGPLKSFAHW